MKSPYRSFGRIKAEKLGCSALFACLLITLLFVTILKQSSHPFPSLTLQLSMHTYMPYPTVKESPSGSFTKRPGKESEMTKLSLNHEEERGSNLSAGLSNFDKGNESGVSKQVIIYPEKLEGIQKAEGNGTESLSPDLEEKLDENNRSNYTFQKSYQQHKYPKTNSDIGVQEGSWLVCDLSEARSDTCSMSGDVRVLSSSYTILLATSSESPFPLENYTNIIKPYARKWEPQSMQNIKELFLKTSTGPLENHTCNLKHEVPAIIFSTGGFLGNFFHDFTDVLIPLFVTSRQFNGNVQFLVTDFNAKWINKYRPILQGLSRFEIINMDVEESIHCFPYVHVGLKSHKVLGIDPSKTPKGYSMTDFKKFLGETFSLKRDSIIQKHSRRKPRLLMILRKGSRSIMNEKQVIMMARRIGYKVIKARPEDMSQLPRFADIVNSCDVMMGVHGAGLANMVFLPENSTVIQIIPLGGLAWACRHDYGEPAPDMGIKYLEYEIRDDESSLIKQYPRDHAVFKDPLSIHRQGWNQLWSIFLDKQMVKLDVGRFRGLLFEVFQSIKQ